MSVTRPKLRKNETVRVSLLNGKTEAVRIASVASQTSIVVSLKKGATTTITRTTPLHQNGTQFRELE